MTTAQRTVLILTFLAVLILGFLLVPYRQVGYAGIVYIPLFYDTQFDIEIVWMRYIPQLVISLMLGGLAYLIASPRTTDEHA